ncbi:Syncytin-A [Merluccius polli]|uniref:Syncytin-A n=1 Tax=Merluccius polli TaxID=89951 RepID=A0AA47MJ31_MERPO|nr:Syncytin-A [Merluccius polli]
MTRARSDIWWFCGGRVLRGVLPVNFSGICAIVQLVMPIFILPDTVDVMDLKVWKDGNFPEHIRHKRDNTPIPGSFDKNIYLDAIGVPRGVPNEHKARNQVAAATINKNVDWVNYIYYNQQRFVNFTTDAVKGLKEQLDATSRMTYQNRLALDMILANQGGVCAMFGTACCTFVPNNTAPDGSVSRALAGLQALRLELTENSGITDPFTDWMEDMFGKWRGTIQSVLLMGIVAVVVLVIIGCCCIPCIRGLLNRLITTAVGVPGESGVLQAYVGIEYVPLRPNNGTVDRPDLIRLGYME